VVTLFRKIIQQKRVLDAVQLFPYSHMWIERPGFCGKRLCGERSLFSRKFDFSQFMSSKNEIKQDHSKRSKVDNLNVHRKCSFID